MTKIRVKLDDKVFAFFRDTAIRTFGNKRGALKKATEEAMDNWIKDNS